MTPEHALTETPVGFLIHQRSRPVMAVRPEAYCADLADCAFGSIRPTGRWLPCAPMAHGEDAQWPTCTAPPSLILRNVSASGTAESEISIRTQNASM